MRKKYSSCLKLIFISLFILSVSTLSAQEQKIKITGSNLTLLDIFRQIETQTKLAIGYDESILNVRHKIRGQVKNTVLKDILEEVLAGTNTIAEFSGKYILIKPAPAKKEDGAAPGKRILKGKVVDDTGEPVIGANVWVKETSEGTVTDIDGNFSLAVEGYVSQLSFSYIGYETQDVVAGGRTSFNITLQPSASVIDEVVVVGFGKQKKESVVGAVQSVKPSELKVTSSNLTTSFAGKIAGVIATQSSGEPGADGANFWIRGISTFGANSSPLIVLDGVEIVTEMLNSIAPETIESFSILKDATATALYGSRGANGVMIITTKTGGNMDRMNINVRAQAGISAPTSIQKIADGVTYMKKYNEAAGFDYFSADKIDKTISGEDKYIYPNNNWYDLMFKDFTFNQNVNVNVVGGSKKIDYFLNAAFHNENGILKDQPDIGYKTNIGLQKYTFQSNVSSQITQTTRIGVKMNTMLQYNHRPYESIDNLFYYAMRANPVLFPVTFPAQEGDDFVRFGNAQGWSGSAYEINPAALMSRGYTDRYLSYLTTVFNLDQDLKFITPGLKAKFQASFYNKTYSSVSRYLTPFYFWLSDTNDPFIIDEDGNKQYNTVSIGDAGTKYLDTSTSRSGHREYSLQGAIEYTRRFNQLHDVNALLVYHQKERAYNTPAADEYEVLPYREQGIAGRITYAYDSRYLFEANFGYNGSENFMLKHRWGFFPSCAVGWNISNEPFLAGIKDQLSLLKIRASWGKTGNDALASRFPYLTTILTGQNLSYYYGRDIRQAKGSVIDINGNEDATWETSTKINLGLEVGLFNELTLILDMFRDDRVDIFMQRRSIPSSAGYSGSLPYANLGKVKNQGLDASLEYNKAFSKDFILSIRGTFTYARNQVIAKDEAALIYPYTSEIGNPINTIYGLAADGLFQDWDDILNSPVQDFDKNNVAPGDIKYRDLNGDGIINGNDVTAIGYPTRPEIVYGIGPSIRYKNWDFSFFLQGTARVSLLMSNMHPFVSTSASGFGMTQWIADEHWSAENPNPNANYPRLTANWSINNTQTSSYYVRDASFIRLKSAEIGYTFKKMRFYIAGTNLLTFSRFKYWDPELGGGNGLSYPLQQTGNIGFQLNF